MKEQNSQSPSERSGAAVPPLSQPIMESPSQRPQEGFVERIRYRAPTGSSIPARGPRTVAAIPAFNERVAIGSVVLMARKYVDAVLVVDDGSSDDTADVAGLAGAIVLRHVANSGKGSALRSIFQWCKINEVQNLVLLDADGQHNPAEIPSLLGPVVTGIADVSLGSRFGGATEMPAWRRVGKRILDYATATGAEGITDSQCGFRAFGRRAIEELHLEQTGFGVESEMLIQARDRELTLTEVPISCRYGDVDGSTENPIVHAAGVLNSIVRMVGERRPLIFLGIPAAASVVLGVLAGMKALLALKETGEVAIGSTVLSSLLILAGVLMGLTALILHVIPATIAKQMNRSARIPIAVGHVSEATADGQAIETSYT